MASYRSTMATHFTGAMNTVQGAVLQGSSIGTYINNMAPENTGEPSFHDCLGALFSTDPRLDKPLDARSKLISNKQERAAGTCIWIKEDDVFKSWKSDKETARQLIWLCDVKGAGKTMLAIFITEHLEDEVAKNMSDDWVLYYFCDTQDIERNTASAILRGLIFQLYKKREALSKIIMEDFKLHRAYLFERHSIEPLWRIFESMVDASPVNRIYCVIDGLDQCDTTHLHHFLKKMNTTFRRKNQEQRKNAEAPVDADSTPGSFSSSKRTPKLRMMILSQREPKVLHDELAGFPQLEVKVKSPGCETSDMKLVIDENVKRVATSTSLSAGSQEKITEALGKGEDRSFLWVSLAAEKLKGVKSWQLKKRIDNLPPSVEKMYMQTLRQVPAKKRTQVAALLTLIALSIRPLNFSELRQAVKYYLKAKFSAKNLTKALALCKDLTITNKDNEVILAHQSVSELLVNEKSPLVNDIELKGFLIEKKVAHAKVANACVAYLSGTARFTKSIRVRSNEQRATLTPAERKRLDRSPFLSYAVVHWTDHARLANADATDYSVEFFTAKNSPRRKLWWESYWISTRQKCAWRWTTPTKFSLLHIAAYFGIVQLAIHLERQDKVSELMRTPDSLGLKPLNWAVEKAQPSMVNFLLARGSYDDQVLRQAVRKGDASIVKSLLQNKMTEEKIVTPPDSPWELIRSLGERTMSIPHSIPGLMSWVADRKDDGYLQPSEDGYNGSSTETPLHIAASYGYDNVLAVLLDSGADVHARTDGHWTPLHNAVFFGRDSVVRTLLDARADPNALTRDLLSPLHCAVRRNKRSLVELFIKEGVELDGKDIYGLTPVHLACKLDEATVLDMLLDAGADIEARFQNGITPLLWACLKDKPLIVEQLLKRGANIDAKWVQSDQASPVGAKVEMDVFMISRLYKYVRVARVLAAFQKTKGVEVAKEDILLIEAAKDEETSDANVERKVSTQQEALQAPPTFNTDANALGIHGIVCGTVMEDDNRVIAAIEQSTPKDESNGDEEHDVDNDEDELLQHTDDEDDDDGDDDEHDEDDDEDDDGDDDDDDDDEAANEGDLEDKTLVNIESSPTSPGAVDTATDERTPVVATPASPPSKRAWLEGKMSRWKK